MLVLGLLLFVARSLQVKGDGELFLGRREGHQFAHSDAETGDLLEELERVVGRESRNLAEPRIGSFEESLRPIFAAMPKNAAGTLDAAVARYLLHRIFVQKHGWFVRGLHNVGETWNSSSPATVFKDHVGEHVQNVFDNHLSNHGFGLRQLAIFAATLESFVHLETLERLKGAHRVSGLPEEQQHLEESDAENVINAYMLMYVLELNHSTVTREKIDESFDHIMEIYPTWPDTVKFVQEVRRSVLNSSESSSVVDWSPMVKVLEEVGMRYGPWQNQECLTLKKTLLALEKPGTGRVPLAKFYGSALNDGNWQFMESVPYLRQLGALDDSDPARLSVIIPNYINSPSNCVASSKFYKVCCIDECDSLLGHLESNIGAPYATPKNILTLVSALSSDTVKAPRELPTSLASRLDDIAGQHSGLVPLHGRLFSQWMHHAYPRECGFPHITGTTKPLEPLDFMTNTGEDHVAPEEEMRRMVDEATASAEPETEIDELPWTSEEELIVAPVVRTRDDSRSWSGGKGLALFVAPCSLTFVVLRLVLSSGDKMTSPTCQPAAKYDL